MTRRRSCHARRRSSRRRNGASLPTLISCSTTASSYVPPLHPNTCLPRPPLTPPPQLLNRLRLPPHHLHPPDHALLTALLALPALPPFFAAAFNLILAVPLEAAEHTLAAPAVLARLRAALVALDAFYAADGFQEAERAARATDPAECARDYARDVAVVHLSKGLDKLLARQTEELEGARRREQAAAAERGFPEADGARRERRRRALHGMATQYRGLAARALAKLLLVREVGAAPRLMAEADVAVAMGERELVGEGARARFAAGIGEEAKMRFLMGFGRGGPAARGVCGYLDEYGGGEGSLEELREVMGALVWGRWERWRVMGGVVVTVGRLREMGRVGRGGDKGV